MENRADTLSFENKLCGIALKSEGMQVADGLLPFACSQIFGCDEEVEHSAVVELQAPVVVAVQLQERNIVWVFLFGLLEIRFAKQFEAIGTLFAVDERQFLGGQSNGSPVLAHYPVRIQCSVSGAYRTQYLSLSHCPIPGESASRFPRK